MPRPLDFETDLGADGRFADRRRALWLADQLRLFAPGTVRIRVSRPRRSSRANSYYWAGVIEPIRRALADAGRPVSAEVLHEYFKGLYLPARTLDVLGQSVTLPPSTAGLDSTAFSEYIEAIKTDESVVSLGVWFEPVPDVLRSFGIDDRHGR